MKDAQFIFLASVSLSKNLSSAAQLTEHRVRSTNRSGRKKSEAGHKTNLFVPAVQ